jgi:hypothetical protein
MTASTSSTNPRGFPPWRRGCFHKPMETAMLARTKMPNLPPAIVWPDLGEPADYGPRRAGRACARASGRHANGCAPPDRARPCARANRGDPGSPPRQKRASGPVRPPMR